MIEQLKVLANKKDVPYQSLQEPKIRSTWKSLKELWENKPLVVTPLADARAAPQLYVVQKKRLPRQT
jgi:hypothetical protein